MLAALVMAVASASVGQTSSLTPLDSYSTGMTAPGRLAATAGGGVYVADQQGSALLEYDDVGTLVGTFVLVADPIGVAVHPDGRVFVSRADGVVAVYDATFLELAVVDATPFSLVAPNDLAYDSLADELYVVDSGAHNVMVFAESAPGVNDWGAVLAFGAEGYGLSEFVTPQAIAIDTNLDHVILTDTDNFRIQVFDTAGVFLFKFGYRTLYFNDTETAWFPRAGGVAVDSCSNIYVSDALMGTVRVFDPTGAELDAAHLPLLTFGTGAGDLRVPMDLAIGGGLMYAASGNNAAVEVYTVACTFSGAGSAAAVDDRTRSVLLPKKRALRSVKAPDNPLDIVQAIEDGTYARRLDLNKDRSVDADDLEVALKDFGGVTMEDFLVEGGVAAAQTNNYTAPHILAGAPVQCGRCHDMDGMPGGGMLAVAGQENLCKSCHSSSGVAMGAVVSSSELGMFHPLGVPADQGVSLGPDPDSVTEIALHLDNGNIRCGTCHNMHNDDAGSPLLRASIGDAKLCGDLRLSSRTG